MKEAHNGDEAGQPGTEGTVTSHFGGLKPDPNTIAEFRRRNKEALKKAMVQCVDGSKIRGNASIKNTWTREKCQQVLEKAEKRIEEVLAEAEARLN